jgi:hypothetical protein
MLAAVVTPSICNNAWSSRTVSITVGVATALALAVLIVHAHEAYPKEASVHTRQCYSSYSSIATCS